MFPTVWYAPTFFSRTYWPGPVAITEIVYRDPYLTDFLTVARDATRVPVEIAAVMAVDANRFVTVEAR